MNFIPLQATKFRKNLYQINYDILMATRRTLWNQLQHHDLKYIVNCLTFWFHFLYYHSLSCFLFPFLGVGLFLCMTGCLLCSFWCTRFWTCCNLSWLFIGWWMTFDLWSLIFIGCFCFLFIWAGTARAFSWMRF